MKNNIKQVYSFRGDNGEYNGTDYAQENPVKKGEYLMPASTTDVKPLAYKAGFAVVWSGEEWQYVEDHRQIMDERGCIVEDSGTPYWLDGDTPDTQPRYVGEIGALPEGALPEPPKNLAWLKELKIREITEERDKREQSPITVANMSFDADTLSYARLQAAYARIAGSGVLIRWTLADNAIAEISEIHIKAVLDAVVDRSNIIFIRARLLKDAVLVVGDYDWIKNLTWDSDLIVGE